MFCSQTRPDGSEEQPAEALTHPEDQQNIDQQEEEVKDDNELGETACELEVPKEGDGAAADEVSLVVNDEIGQMPAEDKVDHVEGIEDLQVEGYHDGGVGGEDVCVIEITEGDVDHNAILNETDLKVEDELPHDKKTDASAEVCEIGVDNQTQCDITIGYIENGHVEAGDLALESLNEPIVEAKYDGVNPETEPDNNYEPHNDVFNEEATNMQSAPDEDPTSRDGFMRDNDVSFVSLWFHILIQVKTCLLSSSCVILLCFRKWIQWKWHMTQVLNLLRILIVQIICTFSV